MLKPRLLVVLSMILAAAASRLIPHPPNMTAVTAMALFAGATLPDKRLAFLVPLGALFVSDLALGFTSDVPVVYLTFAAIVGIGIWLSQRRRLVPIAGAALASSTLFFITTNLGVWAFGHWYTKTVAGLLACYTAAIPFFENTLAGDLACTSLLFGGFALLERGFPKLRDSSATRPLPA
jgi:uncharacterized protein DUF6580